MTLRPVRPDEIDLVAELHAVTARPGGTARDAFDASELRYRRGDPDRPLWQQPKMVW